MTKQELEIEYKKNQKLKKALSDFVFDGRGNDNLLVPNKNNLSLRKLQLDEQEITERIGWAWGEKRLKVFYNILYVLGFIICNLEDFKAHFYGTQNPTKKIIWLKYGTYLIYLFKQLMDKCAMQPERKLASMLFDHFLVITKENGKKYLSEFDKGSVRTTLGEIKRRDSDTFLDTIIETVKDPSHPKIDFDLTIN